MSAYLIVVREETTDAAALKEYRRHAPATFAGHNVKALAAYGPLRVLEGASVEAAVILEFDSVDAAQAWYDSPAYQEVLKQRLKGSRSRAILIEALAK